MLKQNHHLHLLILIIALVLSAQAQVDTASLTGRIVDPNGSAVGGARVTITNQTTNLTTEAATNDDGYYTFTSVRPSLYRVEVA